ncbi:MAG: N-acetylmuramoyl-L-alanine amidase [Clostridia bacterium]|nr:N-acetylmuramoyl-L-alanine amidase [Clostridia bacterium]
MAKRIYISPSSQGDNAYAVGGTNEKEQCEKIAKACVAFLQKQGFQVKVRYNSDMYVRVAESNAFNADMHVAIHTNATAAHNVTGGTSVLLYDLSGERKKAGQAIFDRLSPITPGKSAERLMAYPGFYEIKSTKALTVYCECEFHDTREGAQFIINNTSAIGEAIARGICDYYGVKITEEKAPEKENNAPAKDGTLYVVRCGAFKEKANAEKRVSDLKKAGFEAYIKKE